MCRRKMVTPWNQRITLIFETPPPPPITQSASQAVVDSQASQSLPSQPSQEENRGRKRKRLSNFEFAEIIRSKKIKNNVQLFALANSQREEGKTDLAEFIFNRSTKSINEIMSTVKAMETAEADLERAKLARITILERELLDECVQGCEGRWLIQAEDILIKNGIAKDAFKQAIRILLEHGRGKYRNLLLIGPANCGKSFLLGPLPHIYKCFSNPAATSFAWVGVEDAEVIILNDFRWSTQVNTHS